MQLNMLYFDFLCKSYKGLKFFGRWSSMDTSFDINFVYIVKFNIYSSSKIVLVSILRSCLN